MSVEIPLGSRTPLNMRVTFTMTAGAAASSTFSMTFFTVETLPSESPILIAQNEVWQIEDVYATATSSPDAALQFILNRQVQPWSPRIGEIQQSNLTRYKLPYSVPVKGGGTISGNGVNVAAVAATSNVTVTFYVQVGRYRVY